MAFAIALSFSKPGFSILPFRNVLMTLEYEGNRTYSCEITEFEEGKIKRARAYFAEPFEAPQWRATWVERM